MRNYLECFRGRPKRACVIVAVVCAGLLSLSAYYFISRHDRRSVEVPLAVNNEQTTQLQAEPQEAPVAAEVPPEPEPAQAAPPAGLAEPEPEVQSQWPVVLSVEEAGSLTVAVNKKHKLPSSFVPTGLISFGSVQLKSVAATALDGLFSDAKALGHGLKVISGYRSYSYQDGLYKRYVANYGQAEADTFSARAGHSEHQTGLAVDVGNGVCDLEACFGDTAAAKWLAANAQNYGFIVRYPKGKDSVTGYQYEPWHLRYLGTSVAQAVYASGKTLDEYLTVPAGGYN